MKKISLIPLFFTITTCLTACSGDDNDSSDNADNELVVSNFVQVQTGQNKAYTNDSEVEGLVEGDAFFGQDAHYLSGIEMSFQDNNNGTVTDLNTGLMWQQTPPTTGYNLEEATTYTSELILADYDDWRMPTAKELFSISDFETGWPYINQLYFDLSTDEVSKDEQYWSSDSYVGVTVEGGSNAAFGINHVTGHIKAYAANVSGQFGNLVRAVRGDTYGANDFLDNGDGTISDAATGLMWMQNDNAEALDWEDALSYSENMEFAGYSDWRLPNIKELLSIVDYSRSPTATDSANIGPAIDALFNCTQIVNEAGENDYGYYWSSTSAYFSTQSPGYYYAWYVAFGTAPNADGDDFHGAGAVRFDTKYEGGPASEDGERYNNYVRLVRDI